MRPTYEMLRAALSSLAGFVREVATSALSIPGRIRFKMLRKADKADEVVRRATDDQNK